MNNTIALFIVEDSEVGRTGFRSVFERDPEINVIGECSYPMEVVDQVMSTRPDVILLKQELPDSSGIELTRAITERYPEARILLYAQKIGSEEMANFVSHGGHGYCSSTISVDNLCLAIRSVAAGALWFGPSTDGTVRKLMNTPSEPPDKINGTQALRPVPLTLREHDVLNLVAQGLTNQQIAERLHVSTETIKTHIRRIMDKSAIRKRRELVARAVKEKLV